MSKTFDLAQRTYQFASDCRSLVRKAKNVSILNNDALQLIRSSGSVAANYLEADEALSKKDFVMRIKICRKEARESKLWLDFIADDKNSDRDKALALKDEAYQLVKIFHTIISKSNNS